MPRTVKEHDVRKKEIVDTAERLFLEYGYEETPVEMIIHEVGIAKGTFYHYFRSKDDLLDELVEQLIEEVTGNIKRIAEESEGNAIERIFNVSLYFRNLGVRKQRLTDYLHEDRNVHLHHRLEKKVLPVMAGCYSRLIETGNEEGIFNVKYPYETAVGILGAANYLSEEHHEDLTRHVVKVDIYLAIIDLMERMLGMKEGKLIEFMKHTEGRE
ncbi:MAG: TetR/AcrR family transcriptional regulator [Candidatus Thermoplasmatota archaeon]|nr:TetR/AcrR family transcriptional regulator [Candidatus Thermoplasmatota archaeon]